MADERDICERLEDPNYDEAFFLRLYAAKEIRALRHYVARLEGDLAVAENDLDDMRTYCKLQALDIITLGHEVGRLREALTKTHSELFAAIHYRGYEGGPLSEPSARLAERIALAALAEQKSTQEK
jgi:hypothetical protein